MGPGLGALPRVNELLIRKCYSTTDTNQIPTVLREQPFLSISIAS